MDATVFRRYRMLVSIVLFLLLSEYSMIAKGDSVAARDFNPPRPSSSSAAQSSPSSPASDDKQRSMTRSNDTSRFIDAAQERIRVMRNFLLQYAALASGSFSVVLFSISAYLCYASRDSVIRRRLNDPRINVRPIAVVYKKAQ